MTKPDATFEAQRRALILGEYADPYGFLGMHEDDKGKPVVRTFQPGALSVRVVDAETGDDVATLKRTRDEGLFEGTCNGRKGPFRYRLKVEDEGGLREVEDPYRFGAVLGDVDVHLLAEGNHLRLYEVLGAHARTIDGVDGVAFAVWAPNAKRVSVVGPFNNWDGRCNPMRLRHGCGIWETFMPGLAPGEIYKYEIKAPSGRLLPLKADPCGQATERPPRTASIVPRADAAQWTDGAWMESREATNRRDRPISIYEVHLGSWRRTGDDGRDYLSYRDLADQLIPYAVDMGFTHLELMPVSEFPFDGSWGYQPIGLFAPTSRFGSPEDFRVFMDRAHNAGLGVIVDWVPGHFPTDVHGLGYFDGTHLYEHADPRLGRHMDWGTLIYNYGRREVANYLLANALYWIDNYHLDGLRVDAVASMLYLDYSRNHGEWVPNIYGGNENLEAVAFLKRLNELVYADGRGAMTAAEESTAWPSVSRPTYLGGLGFGYKWNMGWMHDTLRYMSNDPIHRQYHQNDMTFGMLYAFTENFILPLSHDEVVHGKGSLLGKMPGDRWQKFANLRAYYGFMFTHPGKKLLFMGGEFGQSAEWNHDKSLDWHLLEYPEHAGVQKLIRDLNRLYGAVPALHELDCEPEGFEWIDASDAANSIMSFIRYGKDRDDFTVTVCNFTPVARDNYRIGVPAAGSYLEVLNTDSELYAGSGVGNGGRVAADATPMHGRPASIPLTLPPLATIVLRPEGRMGTPT